MKDEVGQATLKDTLAHLQANQVDLAKTPLTLGPTLAIKDEKFVGARAEEANPHLTREYRAPYIVPETKDL